MTTTIQQANSVQQILKYTFGLVPIVAGIDKFTNLLCHWPDYMSASLTGMIPFDPQTFMYIVGVIEIAAGVLVLWKPRIGGYVVMAWLILIALNLLMSGHNFDVAVRDLVMAVGALGLAKLSSGQAQDTLAKA
jgi:uncharacterized membrane protein YphA (DoxX/SURF4 family)